MSDTAPRRPLRNAVTAIQAAGAVILALIGIYVAGFGSFNETLMRVGTYALAAALATITVAGLRFDADRRWLDHYGFRPLDLPTLFGGLSS